MKEALSRVLILTVLLIPAFRGFGAAPIPQLPLSVATADPAEDPGPHEELSRGEENPDYMPPEEETGADRYPASDNSSVYDSKRIKEIGDSLKNAEQAANRNWWYLLRKGKLDMKDTTIVYPRFVKFCVDVYNWADRFFNTYDPEYVVGTGYRWKARLVNENWTDSYALRFRNSDINMRMLSSLNVNIGAYIQYMAVSVGYSVDMQTVFKGKKTDHTRFETNFNCALFNFDLTYTHNTGTYIRQFSGYNNNRLIRSDFPGVTMNNFGVSLYYFLNNKKYSQGAAYNFSKYQKKSAGSWMFGFAYNNLDISMDFNQLSPELRPYFNFPSDYLHLHYFSYCALFGYGFNWVWHPKWVFNITAMPSIGANHCYEDSSDGSGTQFALNIHGRTSLTFNHRTLFASVIGKLSGNWYISKNLSLFNAVEYFSVNVGFRF